MPALELGSIRNRPHRRGLAPRVAYADVVSCFRRHSFHLGQPRLWHEHPCYALSAGRQITEPFDAIVLCTGATDRLMPIQGWNLAGTYSLGGAQIALKSQACAIGGQVVFIGTGPLLYLVAAQYVKAGATVVDPASAKPWPSSSIPGPRGSRWKLIGSADSQIGSKYGLQPVMQSKMPAEQR